MMTPPVRRQLPLCPAIAPQRTYFVVWMRGGISMTYCLASQSITSRFRLPLCRLTGASLMSPPLPMMTPLVHHHMALPLLSHAMALQLISVLVLTTPRLRFHMWSHTRATLISPPWQMTTLIVPPTMMLPPAIALQRMSSVPTKLLPLLLHALLNFLCCMAPVHSMTLPMSCATPSYRCWPLRCFQRLGISPS